MRDTVGVLRLFLAALPSLTLWPLALATRAAARWGGERGAAAALRGAARVQRWWARATLVGLGVELELESQPPQGPFVLAANHVSYLDILVISTLFPSRFVAKSEIDGWPLVGWLGRSVGTIFLVQDEPRDLVRVGREVGRTLDAGVSVSIFPEGAASDGSRVHPFHAALMQPAARAQLPCLAVALSYAAPGSEWSPRYTVAWWGTMPLPGHLWRLVRLPRVRAQVRWSDQPFVSGNRRDLRARLEGEVERMFDPLPPGPIPDRGPLPVEEVSGVS